MLPEQWETEIPLWTDEIENVYQILDADVVEIFSGYIMVKSSMSWSPSCITSADETLTLRKEKDGLVAPAKWYLLI